MDTLPQREESYWLERSPATQFPRLEGSYDVDVAVVGGGIAGLTTAYLLKQSGKSVAVVEKHTIASGTTGGTTGKVTAQHGLIYAELVEQFGERVAGVYANVYMQAMRDIEELITYRQLACGWTRQDNFVYTTDARKVALFRREAKAAAGLGLPASFETKVSLPFPIKAAVKFADQAYFNAAAYTRGLANIVQGNGSHVFEQSQVKHIHEGRPGRITTDHGLIRAKDIVVATKIPPFPLVARFTYAALEYPHTSYIVAGKTNKLPRGMYISPDEGNYSILPVNIGKERYVLIGGQNHIPGLGNADKRYSRLADYASTWFKVKTINYKWKAMDYMAYDKLPLIGPLYPWSKHLFVVTGFKKWGLSTSMVAAKIIRQWINGHRTSERTLFYPHRTSAVTHAPQRFAQETKHIFR
jgi:glycine/D-amino acid oxidase-like deaminating enzyme